MVLGLCLPAPPPQEGTGSPHTRDLGPAAQKLGGELPVSPRALALRQAFVGLGIIHGGHSPRGSAGGRPWLFRIWSWGEAQLEELCFTSSRNISLADESEEHLGGGDREGWGRRHTHGIFQVCVCMCACANAHVCACPHVCMCLRVSSCVCMYVRAHVRACLHVCMSSHLCMSSHVHVPTCELTRVHICVHSRVCMCACAHVCPRMCACVSMHVCVSPLSSLK